MIAAARTLLFVPGNRQDRFGKAAAAGADAVVLDLEDAVAPDDKAAARARVLAWLAAGNDAVVRVNAVGTPWYADDVAAVRDHATAVMVPKAARAADLTGLPEVVALIETAAGVAAARELCAAPNVVRAAFGSIDLATELGVDPDSRTALLHARSALVLASAAAGCAPPIDGVTTTLDDAAVVREDALHAVSLGFTGKLCVHPRQVEPVHEALRPTEDELRWAHAVLGASRDGGVTAVDGKLVDRPVLLRAERLLARAR